MHNHLVEVLRDGRDRIVSGTVTRVCSRDGVAGPAESMADQATACLMALYRAAELNDPQQLTAAALSIGQADGNPSRGYRRAQLLLNGLCDEAGEAVRRQLPRDQRAGAMKRLRGLVGPAQVGLAALVMPTAANEPQAAPAAR